MDKPLLGLLLPYGMNDDRAERVSSPIRNTTHRVYIDCTASLVPLKVKEHPRICREICREK